MCNDKYVRNSIKILDYITEVFSFFSFVLLMSSMISKSIKMSTILFGILNCFDYVLFTTYFIICFKNNFDNRPWYVFVIKCTSMVYGPLTYFRIGFGSYAVNNWCAISTIGKFYLICLTLILEIILVLIRTCFDKSNGNKQENYKAIKNDNNDILA